MQANSQQHQSVVPGRGGGWHKSNSSPHRQSSRRSTDARQQKHAAVGDDGDALLLLEGQLRGVVLQRSRSCNKPDKDVEGRRNKSVVNSRRQLTEARSGRRDTDSCLNAISLEYAFDDLSESTDSFSAAVRLGQGAYGSVYKGLLKDGTEIAIKVLNAPKEAGFEEEVKVLSKFRHPNLVILMGFARHGKSRMLVYEMLSGGDVGTRLVHGPVLYWRERLSIALDAACGLSHLHNSVPKVFHRDIKSANILLDRNGSAKMSDFGLACLTTDCNYTVKQTSGTVGYADPNYIASSVVNGKTEMYSFGMVLVELLTGRPPAVQNDDGSISYIISYIGNTTTGLVKLVDKSADFPPWVQEQLAALIFKCITEDDSDRPDSRTMVQQLRRLNNSAQQWQDETSSVLSPSADISPSSPYIASRMPSLASAGEPPQQRGLEISITKSSGPLQKQQQPVNSAAVCTPQTAEQRPHVQYASTRANNAVVTTSSASHITAGLVPPLPSPPPSCSSTSSVASPQLRHVLHLQQTPHPSRHRYQSTPTSYGASAGNLYFVPSSPSSTHQSTHRTTTRASPPPGTPTQSPRTAASQHYAYHVHNQQKLQQQIMQQQQRPQQPQQMQQHHLHQQRQLQPYVHPIIHQPSPLALPISPLSFQQPSSLTSPRGSPPALEPAELLDYFPQNAAKSVSSGSRAIRVAPPPSNNPTTTAAGQQLPSRVRTASACADKYGTSHIANKNNNVSEWTSAAAAMTNGYFHPQATSPLPTMSPPPPCVGPLYSMAPGDPRAVPQQPRQQQRGGAAVIWARHTTGSGSRGVVVGESAGGDNGGGGGRGENGSSSKIEAAASQQQQQVEVEEASVNNDEELQRALDASKAEFERKKRDDEEFAKDMQYALRQSAQAPSQHGGARTTQAGSSGAGEQQYAQ
eukprot:GHVS01080057.1.p1 GENE.GHVS01080057.1~~GHVS01080057.1.p1  ORF type:complete len:915 (+),score=193.56 GHVS01080057.1:201-2945(+)